MADTWSMSDYEGPKGILDKSTILFHTASRFARNALYNISHVGDAYCRKHIYSVNRDRFDSFLLIYMLGGELEVTVDGRTEIASEGAIVFLNCYKPHAYRALTDVHFYYFHFDGCGSEHYFNLFVETYGWTIARLDDDLKTRVKIYFEDLIHIAQSPIRNEHLASLKIHAVLSTLATSEMAMSDSSRETVQKAVVYVEQHMAKELPVADIANHVSMDAGYFSKIFKNHMNSTPHQYLNNRRIEYAKELLWTTALPIESISQNCGFENATSFYRAFKRVTGYTPGRFRNL